MTRRPCRPARAYKRSRSTGNPARSTGTMARVRTVIAASTLERSIKRVAGSISTKTGIAPTATITLDVATQLSEVVMTSSPGWIPAIRNANSRAAVAEFTTRTGRPPARSDKAASSSRHLGPVVSQPERRTSATAAMVSSSISGRVNGNNSI